MIVDCVTFNGEYELFDLRYNILKDYVDEFIVVEFDKTFSGKDKPLYSVEIYDKYDSEIGNGKIRIFIIKQQEYEKYTNLALSSPNTNYGKGAEHWIREFCQKESIKDCLAHLKDDDIVFIGDVDEIWEPSNRYGLITSFVWKLKLIVYTYYLNNRSNEEFYGPIVGQYKDIKGQVLNHLRFDARRTENYFGWHFTSMGGPEALKKKLTDSYTQETYANTAVIDGINRGVHLDLYGRIDFLGRDFKFWLDESEWPEYLKKNRSKYLNLLK